MNSAGKRSRIVSIAAGSWLTLLFTAWVLLMLWASSGLGRTAAWIPRLVLIATLVCLLLQLATELRVARVLKADAPVVAGNRRQTVAAVAWLGLLLLLTWLLGIAPASAFFSLAWLRLHAGENWRASLVSSTGLGLVLWLVFHVMLGANLYAGVLWSLI